MSTASIFGRRAGKSVMQRILRTRLWWERIKAIQPPPGRYLHVSQKVVETKDGPRLVGVTYNIGRNKAKRQAREAAKFRLVPQSFGGRDGFGEG